MESAQTSQTLTESPKRRFFEAFPIIQFIGAGLIGLIATWTTIQLTQNSQAAEIKRAAEKIERLEKEQTPRDIFDERTNRILDEQKKLNDRFDKFLDKK